MFWKCQNFEVSFFIFGCQTCSFRDRVGFRSRIFTTSKNFQTFKGLKISRFCASFISQNYNFENLKHRKILKVSNFKFEIGFQICKSGDWVGSDPEPLKLFKAFKVFTCFFGINFNTQNFSVLETELGKPWLGRQLHAFLTCFLHIETRHIEGFVAYQHKPLFLYFETRLLEGSWRLSAEGSSLFVWQCFDSA